MLALPLAVKLASTMPRGARGGAHHFWRFAGAPEIFSGLKYTETVDVYSFAIVLWELVMRDEPYSGEGGIQIAYAAAEHENVGGRLSHIQMLTGSTLPLMPLLEEMVEQRILLMKLKKGKRELLLKR